MSFIARVKELVAYCNERLPARIMLSLTVFLSTAIITAANELALGKLVIIIAIALSLVIQFRLWDDVADLPRDRVDHPDRVLCSAESFTHFYVMLIGLCLLNIAMTEIFISRRALIVLILLNIAYLAWYDGLRRAGTGTICGYHVVLLKYPAFVYLLSQQFADQGWLPVAFAMGIVYFCFCAFEVLDDIRLHSTPGTLFGLAVDMMFLCIVAIMSCVALWDNGGLVVVFHGIVTILGTAVLLYLFRRHLHQLRLHIKHPSGDRRTGKWMNYGVFVVGLGWLLSYSIGNFLANAATVPVEVITTESRAVIDEGTCL